MLSCCLITPARGKNCMNSSLLVSMQITRDHKFTFTAHQYNTYEGAWASRQQAPIFALYIQTRKEVLKTSQAEQ